MSETTQPPRGSVPVADDPVNDAGTDTGTDTDTDTDVERTDEPAFTNEPAFPDVDSDDG